MIRASASFVEYFLHFPEKLEKEESKVKQLFWSAREWHPLVKLNWLSLLHSEGEGCITYADGSKRFYDLPDRVRRVDKTPKERV